MKMIKKILILCTITWLTVFPAKAFGEGYYSFGIGYGGESHAISLSLELDKMRKNRLIGLGLSIIFSADDIPSDTLDYPCPHGDYTNLGKRQKENAFALYGKYGKNFFLKRELYIFATSGLYFAEEIRLVRSNITGLHYTQAADDKYKALIGIGLNYVMKNDRNFVSLEYDNMRGIIVTLGIRFL